MLLRKPLVVATLAITVAGSARGQDPAPSPAPNEAPAPAATATPEGVASAPDAPAAASALAFDTGSASLQARVEALWSELRESLVEGNAVAAEERIRELGKVREEAGVRGFPALAHALVVEGHRALEASDYETASDRFRMALELDRGASDAGLGLAAVERARNPIGFSYVSALVRALRSRLGTLASVPFAAANWLLLLAAGLGLAGLSAIAALSARRQAVIRHDVEEWIRHRMDLPLRSAIAWAVLLLPLIAGLDPFWAAIWWGFLLWAYVDAVEKAILGVSLVLVALVVPVSERAAELVRAAADPYTASAITYLDGLADASTKRILTGYVAAHPDDAPARILLALVEERNGEPRPAIATYRELAETDPSPAILNNWANVHYRLDEKDRAFELWKKALDRDPGYAPANYNLSLYYGFYFEFEKKDEHFNKAKALDSAGVDRWVQSGTGVVDAGVDRESIRSRLWSGGSEPSRGFLQAVTGSKHALAALVALVAGALWGGTRRATAATSCAKCAAAFCGECNPTKERADYCMQCVHLFVRKDGVSPQLRAEKMRELGRNQLMQRLGNVLLGLVAPGAGHVYRRQPLAGFALLVVWSLGLAAWFLAGRAIVEPGYVALSDAALPASLGLVVAGAAWVVGNVTNLFAKA